MDYFETWRRTVEREEEEQGWTLGLQQKDYGGVPGGGLVHKLA